MNKQKPFRFGDRHDCTYSMIYPLRSEIKFLRFLIQQGFTGHETLIRHFYWGEFHDGMIRIDAIDAVNSTVTITFKNVAAIDLASETLSKNRKLNDEDFFTQVRFREVSRFQIESPVPLKNPEYYQAEFWKQAGKLMLVIYFMNNSRLGYGRITMEFKSLEVEDISGKLSKYAREKRQVSEWLWKRKPSLKVGLKWKLDRLESYGSKKK